MLAAGVSFFYAYSMADAALPSLEQLVRQYHIVDSPIAALDLDTGMVLRAGGKLCIVISVSFQNSEAGPIVIVESATGLERFPGDAQVDVWHMDGKPFLVEAPAEDIGTRVPDDGGSDSTPPAEDAAGIVPVWRGPKRA